MRISEATMNESSLTAIYKTIGSVNPDWQAEFGVRQGDGWIRGSELENPDDQSFGDLLSRIGERVETHDRTVIAHAFFDRFRWSAGAAIAPYLLWQCIPDIRLSNISLKFCDQTLFQKLSLHEPRAVVLQGRIMGNHEVVEWSDHNSEGVAERPDLMAHITSDSTFTGALRNVLIGHAEPVGESLHEWSKCFKRSLWEQLLTSWALQFTAVLHHLRQSPVTSH
jgi:hypothetical protein